MTRAALLLGPAFAVSLLACAPSPPILTVDGYTVRVQSVDAARTLAADRTDLVVRLFSGGDFDASDAFVTYTLHLALAPDVAAGTSLVVDGTTTIGGTLGSPTESFAPGPLHDARVLGASSRACGFGCSSSAVERVSGTIDVVTSDASALVVRVDLVFTLQEFGATRSYHYTATFTAR